jgi:hypothetical protein
MQIERFSTERDNFEILKLALDKPYTSVLGLVYHDRLIFLNFKRVTEILLTPGGLKVERQKEVALKDWRGAAVVHENLAYLALTTPSELFVLNLDELQQQS